MKSKNKEEKSETTSVALMANTDAPSVIEILDAKIKSFGHISDSQYKTSMNLDGFGDLKKEMKTEILIRAFSMIRGKNDSYNAAAKELDIKEYPVFQIAGGDVEAWKADIKLRLNIINYKETLDKLNHYKKEFSQFLSVQDKKEILLKEAASFLQGL